LDKRKGVLSNLRDQSSSLITSRMIDASLQHATAMSMGAHDNTLLANFVEDELEGSQQHEIERGWWKLPESPQS
jgi:hypothetical protein